MTDFKSRLDRAADIIAAAADISKAIMDERQKGKRMAGDKFFALLDDEKQSDNRLDELALGLMAHRAELEARAKKAIDTKHDRLGAAALYLDRMEGKVEALEASNAKGNGGPTVAASVESPKPSPAAPASLPEAPKLHAKAPSDYLITNGPGVHTEPTTGV